MASNQSFVDFVLDHITDAGEIQAKKMFGEYGVYADGKLFGLICDDKLFIKPTQSAVPILEKSWKPLHMKEPKPIF